MKNKKSGERRARGARLGQHFLNSRSVAGRVAEAAGFIAGDTVLEIGPGKGALTRELLSRGARVIAIEKDEALAISLKDIFHKETESGQLCIVEGDIRNITPKQLDLSTYSLAANIPYYITGEIIRQFLTADVQPHSMSLLVQKEVAQRIARDTKESILSLSVKAYGTPRYMQTVKAGNFSPPPSVDSAILAITDISRKTFANADIREDGFFSVVRAGFSAKRKFLLGNLARVFGRERVEVVFLSCNIPHNARGEDVPLEKWVCLTKTIT